MNYTNDILMIFPIGWTPTSPYLALPLLKGYGETSSKIIEIRDHNIEFYDWLLSNKVITPLLNKANLRYENLIKKEILNTQEEIEYCTLLKILIYKNYLNDVEKWKNIFKNCKSAQSYRSVSKIILTALDLVGFYYDMHISLNSIDSKKYKLTNPKQLLTYVDNDNLIFEFYKNTSLLKDVKQNVIGFSVTSRSQLATSLVACKIIKKLYPDKKVYLGGNFITRVFNGNFSDNVLLPLFKYVDFINLYEGETFIDSFDMFKDYQDVPNIVFANENTILRTKVVKIKYCDYVIPNFDGFDLDKYFTPNVVLPLLSSKNCYSHCAFCTIPFSSSNIHYHQYPINKVVSTMLFLSKKYNTRYFMFNDEVFSVSRIIQMAQYIKKEDLNFKWYCESRFDTEINDEEAKNIYEGGCMHIQFGLESYNQRVIDKMNKKIEISKVDNIVNTLLRNKVSVHLFAIFGFPTETFEEMNNTKQYLLGFMRKSHEKYHISNASIGYGSFALEKGSTVYEHPNDFDIKTIEETDDNFELCIKYEVCKGLSPKLIEEYVNDFNYVSFFDQKTFKADQICLFENNYKLELETVKIPIRYNPISKVYQNDMLFINLNNGVYFFSSQIDKECLDDLLKLYEFNHQLRIFDANHFYKINPFIKEEVDGKYYDYKLNNQIQMDEVLCKLTKLYKIYGYDIGMSALKDRNIFDAAELNDINCKLYLAGILIKVSTIKNS